MRTVYLKVWHIVCILWIQVTFHKAKLASGLMMELLNKLHDFLKTTVFELAWGFVFTGIFIAFQLYGLSTLHSLISKFDWFSGSFGYIHKYAIDFVKLGFVSIFLRLTLFLIAGVIFVKLLTLLLKNSNSKLKDTETYLP